MGDGIACGFRKHVANDLKCAELGWTCVPLAVETYGNWVSEAQRTFSWLASLLAPSHSVTKSKAVAEINDPNDTKCKDLGWWCIPLVVEAYSA